MANKYVSDLQGNVANNDVIGGEDHIITGNASNNKFKAIPTTKPLVLKNKIVINGVSVLAINGSTPNGVADEPRGSIAVTTAGSFWQRTSVLNDTDGKPAGWTPVSSPAGAARFGLEDNGGAVDRTFSAPDNELALVVKKLGFSNKLAGTGGTNTSKVGALVSPIEQFAQVAPLLNLQVGRCGTTLTSTVTGLQYQTVTDANVEASITINNWPLDGLHDFPTGAEFDTWAAALTAYLQGIVDGDYNVQLITLENEPNNTGYRALTSDSATKYLAMLTRLVQINTDGCFNMKIANGGYTGPNFKYLVYKWLVAEGRADDAESFLTAEFTSGNITPIRNNNFENIGNNAFVCNFLRTEMAGLAATGADYANFHWYSSTADTTPALPNVQNILFAKQFVEAATGLPAITNEIGQRNTLASYPPAMLGALVDAGMPYILWYSGDGNAAYGLHDPATGVLRESGTAFTGFVQNMGAGVTEAIQDVFFVEGGAVKLPALASNTPKMLTVGVDGVVSSADVPTSSGGGDTPSLQAVTDVNFFTTHDIMANGYGLIDTPVGGNTGYFSLANNEYSFTYASNLISGYNTMTGSTFTFNEFGITSGSQTLTAADPITGHYAHTLQAKNDTLAGMDDIPRYAPPTIDVPASADYLPGTYAFHQLYILPVITADHLFYFPEDVTEGAIVNIWNKNTSSTFHWTTGSSYDNLNGTFTSALANGTYMTFRYHSGRWLKIV